LLLFNQEGLIKEYNVGEKIAFTTTDQEIPLRWVSRINSDNNLWAENFDNYLKNKITDFQIKSMICAAAGRRTYEIHGPAMIAQLHTDAARTKQKLTMENVTVIPWNKGLTKDTNETIRRVSEARIGENNPMYGKTCSDETRQKLSDKMKSKILSGDFTPKTNNRRTHWDSNFKGKQYRSSWEALFQYFYPNAEYEKLRLTYLVDEVEHIYIVDFIDYSEKIVAEVKPRELSNGLVFEQKIKALTEWANDNDFTIMLIDQQWLQQQPEPAYSEFDEAISKKIRKIYETRKKN
jgi:hypothetical protein